MADAPGAKSDNDVDVETRVVHRAANVGDVAVTNLIMPGNHRPTWRHLLPSTHGATDDQGAGEPSVTIGDLRIKYSGCRILEELRIPPDVSFENCRLHSATYPGPNYGLMMVQCNGRPCIKESDPLVPRSECQVGSIIVAMNGLLIPYGSPLQSVLAVLKGAMRHPPVTLHYVENEDFKTYFKESFLPCLASKSTYTAPKKEEGESDLGYILRVFGPGRYWRHSDSSSARDFVQVITNDENLKCWAISSQHFSHAKLTWENIGRVLAANTYLEELRLDLSGVYDRASAADIWTIFQTQLQANHSLRKLRIVGNVTSEPPSYRSSYRYTIWPDYESEPTYPIPINDERIEALSSYLHGDNNGIVSLSLAGLEFSSLVVIAAAVTGTNITALSLEECDLGHVDFYSASSAFAVLGQLKQLSMVNCESGKTVCSALCTFLPEWSSLEKLDLEGNMLDDKCCLMLANALKRNTTLKSIDLTDNTTMTEHALDGLAPVLCNGSTLHGIESSNHVLTVEYDRDKAGLGCHPKGIHHLISINNSSDSIASKVRRKIATVMFEGDFVVQRLATMHVKLMPRILRFLSHPHHKVAMNYKCSFAAMYYLIRNYDATELFGSSPLAERTGIDHLESLIGEVVHAENKQREKGRALEAENEDLKKESLRARKRRKSDDLGSQ
ncbi:hypothetical protein THAOC_15150 [Thalassiosira oceanica]|uniref:Uncharacterized protein n=1 Tax=Thalassiosira oceanica TaxID=159749 RepID=K0ST35_THAOC|nr:hypothetical protein THAOC_15150 [Thalassiosira oceanica]|eukprot:EJK64146.1 hypothetical protein THAOC_15150 [Thalassiosira oceanica]